MADISEIETIIASCLDETTQASRSKYDSEKAEKTAALFLVAQLKISSLIEDLEMTSKQTKNEVSRIEAEKYFEYKMDNSDKKVTEGVLENYVAKHKDVMEAKKNAAMSEAALKKWTFIINTLKDGHLYFRNVSKNKTWQE